MLSVKIFKTGFSVFFDRMPSGYYCVKLRDRSDELIDKIMCDDYRMAMEYKKAFSAIAKNGGKS